MQQLPVARVEQLKNFLKGSDLRLIDSLLLADSRRLLDQFRAMIQRLRIFLIEIAGKLA